MTNNAKVWKKYAQIYRYMQQQKTKVDKNNPWNAKVNIDCKNVKQGLCKYGNCDVLSESSFTILLLNWTELLGQLNFKYAGSQLYCSFERPEIS